MNFLLGLSSKVYLVVTGVLFGILLTLAASLYFKDKIIDSLRQDLIKANVEAQQEKANNKVLNSEIQKQNAIIDQNKIDYDLKLREFEKWKQNRKVIIKEVKSDECEDIKNILDDIRNATN